MPAPHSWQQGGTDIYVAAATGHRDKVTGGNVDLTGGKDWMPATRRTLEACAGDECFAVQHIKLLRRKSDRVRHVYTTHALGPDVVFSPAALRLGRAWSRLQGAPLTARLLVVASESADGLQSGDVAAAMRALAGS